VFLLVPAYPGSPRPTAVKRLCVRACVRVCICYFTSTICLSGSESAELPVRSPHLCRLNRSSSPGGAVDGPRSHSHAPDYYARSGEILNGGTAPCQWVN